MSISAKAKAPWYSTRKQAIAGTLAKVVSKVSGVSGAPARPAVNSTAISAASTANSVSRARIRRRVPDEETSQIRSPSRSPGGVQISASTTAAAEKPVMPRYTSRVARLPVCASRSIAR
ncbi:hypothetical protein [Kitasatospora arboriphila]